MQIYGHDARAQNPSLIASQILSYRGPNRRKGFLSLQFLNSAGIHVYIGLFSGGSRNSVREGPGMGIEM